MADGHIEFHTKRATLEEILHPWDGLTLKIYRQLSGHALDPGDRLAIIEMAAVSGLELVP